MRKKIPVRTEKKGLVEYPLYQGKEPIRGKVELKVPPGKGVQHQGISAELVGQIGVLTSSPAYYLSRSALTLSLFRGALRPRQQLRILVDHAGV